MPPFYIRTQAVSDYDRLAERKIGYFRKTDIKELLVRLIGAENLKINIPSIYFAIPELPILPSCTFAVPFETI